MTSTPLKTSDISVIIPTFNEAAHIEQLAVTLTGQVGELILVDGGSSDDTIARAEEAGFSVLKSPPGRGPQMNTGAREASGTILLFLHADTELPGGFARQILRTLADGTTALCAFSLSVDTRNPLLRSVIACANLRSRLLNLPYGDQALALRSATFRQLGGFPESAIMEDYALVRKAAACGRIVTLRDRVSTSARRWQKFGVVQTTLINQLMIIGYKIGVPPGKLASLYRKGLFWSD